MKDAKSKKQRLISGLKKCANHVLISARKFLKRNWIGASVILVTTLVFFAPLLIRIGTYSEGGDAMFNAWTLARNHHCILRQGCPSYVDGNIYFPNKSTMLYSETQLSAGVLTLPLHFINDNPLFSYNVWTILSYLFAGIFMYLLAKRLSNNHEVISIASGLIFAFGPVKLGAGAPSHLQNLSIFYLPLIILTVIQYMNKPQRRYLALLLLLLTTQFYASWYQMVFVSIGVGTFLLGSFFAKNTTMRHFIMLICTLLGAVVLTLPLASRYSKFSDQNGATFTTSDQITYSSSVADYLIPYEGSLAGKIYHKILPNAPVRPYNPDSYATAGLTLYGVGTVVMLGSMHILKRRKSLDIEDAKALRQALVFGGVGVVGFLLSLGPVIKLQKNFAYKSIGPGVLLAIPAPWLLINKLLPQLSFIRAIGRINILLLFTLCCLLAYLPYVLKQLRIKPKTYKLLLGLVFVGLCVELMPLHLFKLSPRTNAYNQQIPAVYKKVADDSSINNIIILRARQEYENDGYPFVRTQDVLWAGYHNKNIFNGYSGYEPKQYAAEYADFVTLRDDDIPKMKALGLRYVLVDNELTDPSSDLALHIEVLGSPFYSDKRFALYKL